MKRILTVLLALVCPTVFGQLNIKDIDKSLAKINETLYASRYEVSNRLYACFINAVKKEGKKDLLDIAMIDTLQWREKLAYNEPYVEYYHKHPAYQDYPVVNIRHDAAVLFCEWLTHEYNSNPGRKYKKVQFRLPTESEWMEAARGGNASAVYPWNGNGLKNRKGIYQCNYVREDDTLCGIAGNITDAADITAPVKSYWPNKFGLYNMSGNVAEMVDDTHIVKGGGWKDRSPSLKIGNKNPYDGTAKNSIGFRFFADIIEK
jgi:formylglycine-generating enzyme